MLKVTSTEKAFEIIKEKFSHITAEKTYLSIAEATGRVLAEDIVSVENIPPFDRSTVDGYAVKAADTYGSGESAPVQLDVAGEILMGEKAETEISDGECIRISTGGMLPHGADSVVMVEHTDSTFDELCLVHKAVSPFENVNRKGDDIKEKEKVLSEGTLLTSRHMGILAALGISEVGVFRKLKVGIISTGDEIVPIDSDAPFGKIRDINSYILSSLMTESGCQSNCYGIVRDNREDIVNVVSKAVSENDIVLISGGSSAGARDMTAEIISSLGELYLHGIAMKPGKPTIIGKIDGKAVFGLPGHPLAVYCVTMRLVGFLIDMIYHRNTKKTTVKGKLLTNISSNHGREEIICVNITSDGIMPVYAKSGAISLLSRCDGYIVIDRNCEGLKQGEETDVCLF